MESILGRKLEPNEVVHHINGIKSDNRPENLQVMDRAEHTKMHRLGASVSPETIAKLSESHKGIPNANRKLSEDDVIEILTAAKAGESDTSIAKRHNISGRVISNIRHGRTYKDITSKLPPELFPVIESTADENHYHTTTRLLSIEQVSEIRMMLRCGHSVNSIAKKYGVSTAAINGIKDGYTYADIPSPELIASYTQIDNIHDLADIMLLSPIPENTDPLAALKNDYHLLPSRNAVIIFKLLQRALNGNAEDALLLYALSSFDYMIDKIINENSIFSVL